MTAAVLAATLAGGQQQRRVRRLGGGQRRPDRGWCLRGDDDHRGGGEDLPGELGVLARLRAARQDQDRGRPGRPGGQRAGHRGRESG